MTWWKQIPEAQKAFAAVFAIIVMLFVAGLTLGKYIDLPEKVEALESRTERLENGQGQIMRGIDRTNCYLDNIVNNTPERRCP